MLLEHGMLNQKVVRKTKLQRSWKWACATNANLKCGKGDNNYRLFLCVFSPFFIIWVSRTATQPTRPHPDRYGVVAMTWARLHWKKCVQIHTCMVPKFRSTQNTLVKVLSKCDAVRRRSARNTQRTRSWIGELAHFPCTPCFKSSWVHPFRGLRMITFTNRLLCASGHTLFVSRADDGSSMSSLHAAYCIPLHQGTTSISYKVLAITFGYGRWSKRAGSKSIITNPARRL